MTLLDLQTQVLSQLTEALVGDRRKYGVRLRRDIRVVLDAEEVGCAALFDVFVLGCVEVHDARIAELVSVLARHKAGCIVTAHLHVACSTWSSTVLFAVDCDLHRLDAAFEVSAYGRAVNHQQGILGGFYTQSCRRAEHNGAQVERCAGAVGRDETLVALNHFYAGFDDHIDRRYGQAEAFCRRLQAFCILFDAEQTYFAVSAPEGFQALEKSRAVVKAGCRHVHVDVLVACNFHFAPLAVRASIAGIEIGLHVVEAERAPIDVLHCFLILKVVSFVQEISLLSDCRTRICLIVRL